MRSRLVLVSLMAFHMVTTGELFAGEAKGRASASKTKEAGQAAEISCVLVRSGVVFPFKTGELPRFTGEQMKVRCAVPVALTGDAKDVTLTMKAVQDGNAAMKASARQIVPAWALDADPRTAEIEVKLPKQTEECLSMSITVTVAGVKHTALASPAHCDD